MQTLLDFIDFTVRFEFMQRALAAIVIIGAVSGVVGAFVVTRGMAFLGDALAHTIVPGVAVAFLATNGNPQAVMFGGVAAGVLSALGIGWLTRGGRLREDTAIGIVFAAALALGIGILSRAQDSAASLNHILIGNVFGVTGEELAIMGVIAVMVVAVVVAFYKEFLVVSFDPTLSQTLRLPAETLRIALLVVLALTVMLSLQALGVALVAALLVTPAATARLLVERLHHLMIAAALIGALGGVVGMFASWALDVAPSAAVVLTLTGVFALAFVYRSLRPR